MLPEILELDAALDPAAAATLFLRGGPLGARRAGRTRSQPLALTWLDTAEGILAAQRLALAAPPRGPRLLLQALPPPGAVWSPGCPAATLATLPPETVPPQAEGAPLLPVAALAGRRRLVPLAGGVEAVLLEGRLSAGPATEPLAVARLTLGGPRLAVLETMRALAGALAVLPPRASLAEQGRALALGEAPRPRRLGAPRLDPAMGVEEALRCVLGHLMEVLLWHAPVAHAGSDPAGVHQMRVALRRLRSALRAFRAAADGAELRELDDGLKALARVLGPARDWDVFLGGLGAELAAALPGEARLGALLAAARQRRDDAYAALRLTLDGPEFRRLVWDAVALEATRPWRATASEEVAARRDGPLEPFAAGRLDRGWRRLTEAGSDIAALPDAEFHALRLEGKRMRYLAELFAPLWGRKRSRRFLERLAEVQEQFGLANDTVVARGLVAPLAAEGHAWAAGLAEGWVMARARRARGRAAKAWEALLETEPFWNQG